MEGRYTKLARVLGGVAFWLANLSAGSDPDGPELAGKRILAWWTFEEPGGAQCVDRSGNDYHAAAEPSPPARASGVFGKAILLRGQHRLAIPQRPEFRGLSAISFSAWVVPVELSGYREIFRKEDGDRRVLFSFQIDGTILSLGLNIGGYVECDAPIDPKKVLDGAWHHCAATFDGRTMRVYLDGAEIGRLERPGKIEAGGGAPGCIGSSDGNECFQGRLDDLRIYADALDGSEVRALYEAGLRAIEARTSEALEKAGGIYARGASFARTLSASRAALAERGLLGDLDVVEAVERRLRADFPAECSEFTAISGRSLATFLASEDTSREEREAERLVELMLEYRPLTPEQWEHQSAAEREAWEEADAIAERFAKLRSGGPEARAELIEVMLQAGRRVQERPRIHEAVAPYVRPSTPETRDLSPAEAQEALRRDWLHQADGDPSPLRTLREIVWARELARRIERAGVDVSRELALLERLEGEAALASGPDAELYFRVREVKRSIAFRNPVFDFDRVLFIDNPYPQGSEWRHETRHRLGYMAVPGGRLLVLEGLWPGGKVTQLLPKPPLHGSFWRPDLSYDATRVLVSFKAHNEKSFHLWEVGIDGSGARQLTWGPFDDLDPIYLPDERHIIFSTTRAHTYVRCMPPTNAYVLARCDRDGRDIYILSQNNEPDYLPSVLDDGRIIYTRWEYTDKPLWRPQKLWTVNPDGTGVIMYWGNQSVWPDLVKDARQIPGSRRVMVTGSAHHDWFSGSVAIIDVSKGLNFPHGITKVTADVPWPECGNGPVDPVESPRYHASGRYGAYYSPYPLSEEDFLVSAERGGKFLLYWMDVFGNRELIYEGVHNVFHAIPVRARRRPPALADRVDWPSREERLQPRGGLFYSADVLEGLPSSLRGKVRYLRVLHIEPKTYTYWYKRPYISTGPVVSAVQSDGVKRILGTVPVEADGSVYFRAPAGKALHFQILDERRRALQTMRSFVGLMPGESRGCLGCHESHSRAPPSRESALALRREPSDIEPPPWGEDTVSYPRYVQPVLDRHCGPCHQGEGEARKVLDLTLRPGFDIFTEPYLTLIGRPTWGAPYVPPPNPPPGFGIAGMLMVEGFAQTDPAGYRTPEPLSSLSYASRLIEIASSGNHHGVRVDPVSLERLIGWVDAMCPYVGEEEIREIPDPEFQGVDWLAIRPRIRTAPKIVRPGPLD